MNYLDYYHRKNPSSWALVLYGIELMGAGVCFASGKFFVVYQGRFGVGVGLFVVGVVLSCHAWPPLIKRWTRPKE